MAGTVGGAEDKYEHEEVAGEVDAQTSSTSASSLTELSRAAFINPLKARTRANLNSVDEIRKVLGPTRILQGSATTGKRWISVQAYNQGYLNDWTDPDTGIYGVIIKVTKKPSNGSGWDEVVLVEDVTDYSYINSTPGPSWPSDSSNLTTVNTSDYIILKYDLYAFSQHASYTLSGVANVHLKVTFASGHIIHFGPNSASGVGGGNYMRVPMYSNFQNKLNFAGGASTSTHIQQVYGCTSQTNEDWYSLGPNSIQTDSKLVGDFAILTSFVKLMHNPGIPGTTGCGICGQFAGTITTKNIYRWFGPSSSAGNISVSEFINPINFAWGDEIIDEWGTGCNSPDQLLSNYFTHTAEFWARIDILAQDSNENLHPFFETSTGLSADHTYFTTGGNFTIPTNITTPDTLVEDVSISSTCGTGSYLTYFSAWIAGLQNNHKPQAFVYTQYYSDNIPSCLVTPETTYTVCDTVGNPSYWQLTNKDCGNNTIPSTDLPGGSNYGNVTYVHDNACCTDCGNFGLQSVTTTDATYNVNNGIVSWNARVSVSGQMQSSGDTWGSGSMYTVTITNSSGTAVGTAAPTGGNTVSDATCDTNTTSGTAHLVTCDSNTVIKPGMKVTGSGIPTNTHSYNTGTFVLAITAGTVGVDVTQFSLCDYDRNPVNATAAANNVTLTFSTGDSGEHGGLAPNDSSNPFYQICLKDEISCEECVSFTIGEDAPSSGCTDSTAVNYDSGAVVDDGSCMLCNATTGLLEDPSSSNTTELFDNTIANSTAATWGGSSHNSDGTLAVSANVMAGAVSYMDWNSDSKFEILLYKTVNPGDASTASGATQIGGTINAGTLDNVSLAAYNFTGLAYGYYTIRVRYVDISHTSTLENCWTEFYGVVKAEVCDDAGNSSYHTTPADIALREPNNSLLCTGQIPCCTLDAINVDDSFRGTTCQPILYSQVECDPSRDVTVQWSFSTDGSTWTWLGSYNLGYISTGGDLVWAAANNIYNSTNWFLLNGDGYYKVEISANNGAGDICVEEKTGYFTLPISGCTTPGASNYDPSAQCPSPCFWESYDCDGIGNCTDPGDGSGQYPCNDPGDPLCCNNMSCPPPEIEGCTDACAENYDALANVDDGSCEYTACLDSQATNQGENCCLSQQVSNIVAADNSCCLLPCDIINTLALTTTNSSSTCTTYNLDGTALVTPTINNGATTWTWKIYDNAYLSVVYTDTTTYNAGDSSSAYSLLGSGNYVAEVTDNLGCITTETFTINSDSSQVGCMDPNADNYDANAICDCCCQVAGCMDPNATNYNPNANVAGPCEYNINPAGTNPCVPSNLIKTRNSLRGCLVLKGTDWLRKYKVGRADDCSIMDEWKLILIHYLLSQEKTGLDCLFNCADATTPAPTLVQDCDALWKSGGPSTGPNHDANHVGASIVNTGEGTTVTAYDGFPSGWFGFDSTLSPTSNKTFTGDVIKFDLPTNHPLATWLNGTIWKLTAQGIEETGYPNLNGLHEGCHNQKLGHYTQCLDYNTVTITTNINYYDKFINFVNKFCQKCDISILKTRK